MAIESFWYNDFWISFFCCFISAIFPPPSSLSLSLSPLLAFSAYLSVRHVQSLRACDPQLESLDTTLRYIIIQKRSHGIYMVVSCAISISISGLNSRVKRDPPAQPSLDPANIGESVVSENTKCGFAMENANRTKSRVSTTMTSASSWQQINETQFNRSKRFLRWNGCGMRVFLHAFAKWFAFCGKHKSFRTLRGSSRLDGRK